MHNLHVGSKLTARQVVMSIGNIHQRCMAHSSVARRNGPGLAEQLDVIGIVVSDMAAILKQQQQQAAAAAAAVAGSQLRGVTATADR